MQRPPRKPITQTTHTANGLRPKKAEVDELVSKISDLVSKSPAKASNVLEHWLKESARPEKKKKSA
jgi:hypothetical protein